MSDQQCHVEETTARRWLLRWEQEMATFFFSFFLTLLGYFYVLLLFTSMKMQNIGCDNNTQYKVDTLIFTLTKVISQHDIFTFTHVWLYDWNLWWNKNNYICFSIILEYYSSRVFMIESTSLRHWWTATITNVNSKNMRINRRHVKYISEC